jgi:hypothetical protein
MKHCIYADRDLRLIGAVLRHFSLEQLVDIVFPEFKISWPSVKRIVIKEQLPLTKDSIIKVMVFALKVIQNT